MIGIAPIAKMVSVCRCAIINMYKYSKLYFRNKLNHNYYEIYMLVKFPGSIHIEGDVIISYRKSDC